MREENELNLRNQTEFRNPFTRLQLFANSFFPSTIKSWNKLSLQLRNASTLNRFKQATKNQTIKPPKFNNAGCRILNIIHTRLRLYVLTKEKYFKHRLKCVSLTY